MLQEMQERIQATRDVFTYGEERGYTELLLGNLDVAEDQLERGAKVDRFRRNAARRAGSRHCARVLRLLRKDPSLARAQLDMWADESAKALAVDRMSSTMGDL